ncbi:P-type conjugative transfer protein TrbJ [Shewanella colwelliana]|uniref:P-type conjugative transfer protein TrbJ n=1 Tax=Shewanella colwelliana TaxID=23 RepID=UPI003735988A
MKKITLLIAGVFALSAVNMPTAQAWPVVCVNCGTEWTQIANNIQLASQYAEQVRQTINQVEQLRWQMQNTKRLASGDWGNTFEQLNTLNKLAQRGDSIAFSSGDLMEQMNNTYKGYENWQRDISPQEYEQNYKKLSQSLGDTASASLQVANGLYQQKQEDERLLNTLEQQSQGASGRLEAIQAGNQMSAQVIRHLQKVETLLSSQIQMTAAFMQTKVEKEQLEKAQEAKFKKTDFPKREDRSLGRFKLIQ